MLHPPHTYRQIIFWELKVLETVTLNGGTHTYAQHPLQYTRRPNSPVLQAKMLETKREIGKPRAWFSKAFAVALAVLSSILVFLVPSFLQSAKWTTTNEDSRRRNRNDGHRETAWLGVFRFHLMLSGLSVPTTSVARSTSD